LPGGMDDAVFGSSVTWSRGRRLAVRRGSTLSITHISSIVGDLGPRLFGLLFACATAVSAVVLGLSWIRKRTAHRAVARRERPKT